MKRIRFLLLVFMPAVLLGASGDVVRHLDSPGSCPTGLAFDGNALWVADRKEDALFRVDPASGEILKRLDAPGYFCTGLAWDGEHLWVADQDFRNTSTEYHTGKIYEVCPETGRTLHMIEAPYSDPQGLAWDGEFLWMSDNGEDKLVRISPEDGTTIAEFRSPASDPHGLAWDGAYLWVSDRTKDEVYRVHPGTGIVVMILPSPGPYAWGLAWGNRSLWNADYQEDAVEEIRIFDDTRYSRSNERYADVVFTHEVMNLGPGTVRTLDVHLSLPRSRDTQDILDISYSTETDVIEEDRWGQRCARFSATDMEPGDVFCPVMTVRARTYEVNYHIFPERVGTLDGIPKEIRKQYLQDGSKYWTEHPTIQSMTRKVVGEQENPYWIARDIFDFLRERMFYERIGGWDIAPAVLERGSGSCSEYTFVYIAMCRAAGVPARYAGAVVVRGDDASMDYVYHRWVEVYLPNYGWIPVDPSGGDREWPRDQTMFFGHLSNRFLITTEGGGDSDILGWDYNSTERWTAEGPVRLRMEKIAEWEPVKAP